MKAQKFNLIDDPVQYSLLYYERKISNLMSLELTGEREQEICENFEFILTKAFYALYGSRTDMDGFAVEKFNQTKKKTTLEGKVYWLQGDGFGHYFKIDLAHNTKPLLYSYKFYDFPHSMNQTLYIAKMPDSWVVDRICTQE